VSSYQDRLWGELVERHGSLLLDPAPPAAMPAPASAARRRRRRRLVPLASALALLLAGAVALELTLNSGRGAPPAYAVTQNADGTVTVELHELVGVHGANTVLAALGVAVRVVPVVSDCAANPSRYTFVPTRGRTLAIPQKPTETGAGLRVYVASIPAGDTLVIAADELQPGAFAVHVRLLHGATPPCLPRGPGA